MANERETPRALLLAIGDKLQKAREKLGLEIEQVQAKTRIHSTILRALEEGRCDEILTPTYVKSFLKKYAAFLGVDPAQMLNEYSVIHREAPAQNLTIDRIEVNDTGDFISKFKRAFGIILLLIAVILAVFLVSKMIGNVKKIVSKQKTSQPARQKPDSRTLKTDAKKKASVKKDLSAQESKASRAKLAEKFKVVLKVKQTVMAGVRVDGVLLFKHVLHKGTVETFTAKDNVTLYVGKAESIDLSLDGNPLDIPGRGPIERLEITRKGATVK